MNRLGKKADETLIEMALSADGRRRRGWGGCVGNAALFRLPLGEEGAAGLGAVGASCPGVTRGPWQRRGREANLRAAGCWGGGRSASVPGLPRQAAGRWG